MSQVSIAVGATEIPLEWGIDMRKRPGSPRPSGFGAAGRPERSGPVGSPRRSPESGARAGAQAGGTRRWVRQPYRPTAIATITFYGPDDATAVKAVVRIYHHLDRTPVISRSFWGRDPRVDPQVRAAMAAFIQEHKAKQVLTAEGIAGCPHIEGVDYPAGEACPRCRFWRKSRLQA